MKKKGRSQLLIILGILLGAILVVEVADIALRVMSDRAFASKDHFMSPSGEVTSSSDP